MNNQQPSNYVVNTNYSHNPQAHADMLKKHKAAAYYAWKHKITNIQQGDRVFLYQSTVGIIAVGTGTGTIHTEMYEGSPEEEYNTKLDNFIVLKTPMTAAEMRRTTHSHFAFVQTIFTLAPEKAGLIWHYIQNHCLSKRRRQ